MRVWGAFLLVLFSGAATCAAAPFQPDCFPVEWIRKEHHRGNLWLVHYKCQGKPPTPELVSGEPDIAWLERLATSRPPRARAPDLASMTGIPACSRPAFHSKNYFTQQHRQQGSHNCPPGPDCWIVSFTGCPGAGLGFLELYFDFDVDVPQLTNEMQRRAAVEGQQYERERVANLARSEANWNTFWGYVQAAFALVALYLILIYGGRLMRWLGRTKPPPYPQGMHVEFKFRKVYTLLLRPKVEVETIVRFSHEWVAVMRHYDMLNNELIENFEGVSLRVKDFVYPVVVRCETPVAARSWRASVQGALETLNLRIEANRYVPSDSTDTHHKWEFKDRTEEYAFTKR